MYARRQPSRRRKVEVRKKKLLEAKPRLFAHIQPGKTVVRGYKAGQASVEPFPPRTNSDNGEEVEDGAPGGFLRRRGARWWRELVGDVDELVVGDDDGAGDGGRELGRFRRILKFGGDIGASVLVFVVGGHKAAAAAEHGGGGGGGGGV